MTRSFFAYLAQYRTFVIAVVSVVAPLFYAHWFQTGQQRPWLFLFVGSMLILVLAGLAPRRYEKLQLLESILPTIHKVLNLSDNERVTIHHIKSVRREKYEQLVDYYPKKFGGGGRVFSFSLGIVGECFKSMDARTFSIPPELTFEEAMRRRGDAAAEELGHLRQDRRSFFAIAIGQSRGRAKPVLYLDSSDPNKFSDAKKQEYESKMRELFLPQLEQILLE